MSIRDVRNRLTIKSLAAMALVIVSGLPSSGRTSRVEELTRDWTQRIQAGPNNASSAEAGTSSSSFAPRPRPAPSAFKRIVHLTDSTLHLDKTIYASQLEEKPARASYLSLVQRNLADDAIVVADGGPGLNIKGFRYQLWCAAREVGLNTVSIFVTAPPEQCLRWNAQRRDGEAGSAAYDEETIKDLLMRFEEPNPMTRWDSPLFILPSLPAASIGTTESIEKGSWEPPPYEDIWTAVVSGKVARAPGVVTHNRTTSSNYLSLLEACSQALVAAFVDALQQEASMSMGVGQLMPPSLNLSVRLPQGPLQVTLNMAQSGERQPRRPPTPAQLQRLRRQFVKMHSAGFASGNLLGKTAKEEGSRRGQSTSQPKAATTQSGSDAEDQQPAAAPMTSEETVVKRFASWLEEIIPTL
ncbi:unnamed protein product [Parajaminaea phylloscopi]